MQGISNFLRIHTKTVDKVCSKHGVKMIQVGNREPFCLECQKEKQKQEEQALVANFMDNRSKRYFETNSIITDTDVLKHSFSNYEAPKGSDERRLGALAFKIAKEYIANGPTYKRNAKGKVIKEPGKPMVTFLAGNTGQGKTHLAMSMLKEIMNNSNQNCVFVDVSTLFDEVTDYKNPSRKWNETTIAQKLGAPSKKNFYEGADVVVLDDLGTESSMAFNGESASTYKQRVLKTILDSQKRIIVTTNLTLSDLRRVYNPKLVSRLLANSNGRRLEFEGQNDKRWAR